MAFGWHSHHIISFTTMPEDAKIQDIAIQYIRKQTGDRATESYESLGELHPAIVQFLPLADEELVITSAFFSADSWYAFTTRRIVSQFQGKRQSLEPSRRIKMDFPNFKGYDPDDKSDFRRAGVIPRDIATITDPESGTYIRIEYHTFRGSTPPMYAVLYWQIKHPILHKLLTTAELEHYIRQRSVSHPKKERPAKPARPAKELAQEIAKWHTRGVISIDELWGRLLGCAKPDTLAIFMSEFTPETRLQIHRIAASKTDQHRTDEYSELVEAVLRWYEENSPD